MTEDVTIVVMTRDRWDDLQGSLPRHEVPVILVDNGSSDGTPEKVRAAFPHVEVVELDANHGSAARNIGVELARTPYVAFADDDSWWAPGSLARAAAALDAHPRLAVLAARMLVGEAGEPDPICRLMERSPLGTATDLPGPEILGFLACGAVVRREAFLAAGGFDDVVFFMGEEERLALDLASLGWGLSYVADVVACHHPSPTRNHQARKVRATRNRILTTVLRRPWPVVARTFLAAAGDGRPGRAAVAQATARLPRALAQRRGLPGHVEAARKLLDAPTVDVRAPATTRSPRSARTAP